MAAHAKTLSNAQAAKGGTKKLKSGRAEKNGKPSAVVEKKAAAGKSSAPSKVQTAGKTSAKTNGDKKLALPVKMAASNKSATKVNLSKTVSAKTVTTPVTVGETKAKKTTAKSVAPTKAAQHVATVKVVAAKVTPAQAEPVQVKPAQVEAKQVEVKQVETAQVNPAKVELSEGGQQSKGVELKSVVAPAASGKSVVAPDDTTAAAPAGAVQGGTNTVTAPRAPAPSIPQKLVAPKAAPVSAKSDRDEQIGEQKAMKTTTNKHGFKLSEFVVYPAHGVGQIVSMEEQEVAGFKLELFVINFVKDKMTLRVPTSKVTAVGMRKLSDMDAARRSLDILTGRARVKRTMWSRRAQEYEAKINSGDINAIAEVVRDLFRSDAQPEQSYSERQLYEAALDRMMREIAAVHKLTETEALKMIDGQLKKNVKRAAKPETAGGEAEVEDTDIEEAA